MTYPDLLRIEPTSRPMNAIVSVPGSKSLSNRALVLAALHGDAELANLLHSDDTAVMLAALKTLGFSIDIDGTTVRVRRPADEARLIPATSADLFVGNSGTTVRFLAAMLSLVEGTYTLDGVPRMRERPIEPLLEALRQLGVTAESTAGTGCPPVRIASSGWKSNEATVRADVSSQYLSGLLMAAPFAGKPISIRIDGSTVSEPYIDMTISQMQSFCHAVERIGNTFRIEPWSGSKGMLSYAIEPDASTASYFFAAAAIAGGKVVVRGTHRRMLQGDIGFVAALERMGCESFDTAEGLGLRGGTLRGIDIDMNAISDTAMTLAAVACFAEGPTTIRNVAHIRHKETDRIAALAKELRKLGAGIEEFPDGLRIEPRPLAGCEVDTYDDHRMAMSLALIGLKVDGVAIRDPGCVAKTHPRFWVDFDDACRQG